jgi:hypothetical protein
MRIAANISLSILGIFILQSVHAGPSSLLKTLGLHAGQSYSLAKTQLIAKGWKVDTSYSQAHEAAEPHSYGFNEVVCGRGWQAVCSARFLRKDQKIMLTLRPKKVLLVDAAWDESQGAEIAFGLAK